MSETTEALRERRTTGYETPRPDVMAHVPPSAKRILEVGCSSGALGEAIKRRQAATILGVEIDPDYGRDARDRLDRVVIAEAESFLAGREPPEAPFDCLVAADVLEHLTDPWTALRNGVRWLSPGASVVISLPNVLHYRGLWRVVRERSWPRDDEGIFDRTHLRWFSLSDALGMLRQAGVEPTVVDPRYFLGGKRLRLTEILARTTLSAYLPQQYVIAGRKLGS
jgi:2-polyprenyl-3-methyl-5-hydroxy-6-metoxy-1,4-benzoquinol methylase